MASAAWEHQDEAREALRAIVSDPEYGVAALSSSQTMSNLLKDYLPDAPREKSVLVAAAEAGLPGMLQDQIGRGMDPHTAAELTAASFAENTAYPPETCAWVVGELSQALGLSGQGDVERLERQRIEQDRLEQDRLNRERLEHGGQRGGGQDETVLPPPPPPPPPPPARRRSRKGWFIAGGAVVAIIVVLGVVGALTHGGSSVEPVSKIIRPDVTGSCKPASKLKMTGVITSETCPTSSSSITIWAWQFDNSTDYQSGITHLENDSGYDPSLTSSGNCPPSGGDVEGSTTWHSIHNPDYKSESGQILQCYTDSNTKAPAYLWTLPSKNVILQAFDSGSGATLNNLDNWWSGLNYRN